MKIKLLDINKFIEENNCLLVDNPVMFESGNIPTNNGLFSYEIFGNIGSQERNNNYGYINLNDKFLNPVIYRLLKSIDRKISDLISGNRFVSLDKNGYIVDDEEKGETGLNFLYKNWSKINFKASDSEIRKTKLRILKETPKDEIFIDKFLVMPAMLRDFNVGKNRSGTVDYDELNEIYSKIIRLSQGLTNNSFSFIANNTRYQIQELLLDIYDKLVLNDLSGKKGMFRKHLMGKSIDYATRSVITAPNLYSNNYKDQEVPFGYTGVPLDQVVVLFYPFFLKYITDFVEMHKDAFENIVHNGNEIIIDDIDEQFSDTSINRILGNYIRDYRGRLEVLRVKNKKDGKFYPVKIFSKDLGRDFTITDLLYIAAIDITEDKHVYVTRYPITSFQSIYPSKIKVLTTNKTMEVTLENRLLKNYPVIYPEYPANGNIFISSVRINNSYTKALGADYDGDTISLRSVFTQEANDEVDKLVRSKTMILNQSGKNTRRIGNDASLAIYSFTK